MATSNSGVPKQPHWFSIPLELKFWLKSDAPTEIRLQLNECETKDVFDCLNFFCEDVDKFLHQVCGCDAAEVLSDRIVCYFGSCPSFLSFSSQYYDKSLQSAFCTFLQRMDITMDITNQIQYKNHKLITDFEVDDTYFIEATKHFTSLVSQSSATSNLTNQSSSPTKEDLKAPGFVTGGGNKRTPVGGVVSPAGSCTTVVTPPSSGCHHKPADDEKFITSFQLFTHDYNTALKVSVVFTNNNTFRPVNLIVSRANPLLWCVNDVVVQRGLKYVYRVSYSYARGYLSKEAVEELERSIRESAYHRDIFRPAKKPLTSSQLLSGWKIFVLIMLQGISNKRDMGLMLKEYSERDMRELFIAGRRELAGCIVQKFCEINNPNICVEQAVFVVYVLSTLLLSCEDWKYCKITQADTKCLLSALHNIVLEEYLSDDMRSKIVHTLTRLVTHSHASATWLAYVHHCFPLLTSEELLENGKSFRQDFSNAKYCADVAHHIWFNRNARLNGFASLLTEVFRNAALGLDLLAEYKHILDDKYEHVEALRYLMKQKVSSILKACASVEELLKLATDLLDVGLLLHLDLTQDCETAVKDVVLKAGFTDEQASRLLSFVNSTPLFADQQAFPLLDAVSRSKSFSIHQIFPALMRETKFSLSVLHDDLLRLVDIWLDTFGKISEPKMGLKSLHDHMWQLVALPAVEKTPTLKQEVTEKVTDSYRRRVCKAVKSASLTDIEEIITDCSSFMDDLRQDIIDNIINNTVKTTVLSSSDTDIFKRLILSQGTALFSEESTILKLLEALASSKVYTIYAMFFSVLNNYCSCLSKREVDIVVDKWLSMAKEMFSKKAHSGAGKKSLKPYVLYITLLYEFAQEALSDIGNDDVTGKLTTFVKCECRSLTHLHVELLEICYTDKTSLSLLEKHLCEIQEQQCPPPSEVFTMLKKMLLLKRDRSIITNSRSLHIFLDHMLVHSRESVSFLSGVVFYLNNSQTASMIHQDITIKQHKAVIAMNDVMKDFVHKVKMKLITVNEFAELNKCFQQKDSAEQYEFIQFFFGNGFKNFWEQLTVLIGNAKQKLTQTTRVFEVLLSTYSNVIISDKEDIKEKLRLKRLQLGLEKTSDAKSERSGNELSQDESGSCVLLELGKPGFYGCLEEILPCARRLEQYCDLKTFVCFCHTYVTESTFESVFHCSSPESQDLELSCATLFGEEEPSGYTVTMLNLAFIFAEVCTVEYKKWFEGLTETATLDYVMRYCPDEKNVHDDIKKAVDILHVELSPVVTSSLLWFSGLLNHRDRMKLVEKLLDVYGISMEGESADYYAFKTFHNCLASLKGVTVKQLAEAMTSLEQILSVSNKDYWEVVEELSLGGELLRFLLSSLDDDFRFLIDAVEERSEQTIDESTVSDLIRVKQFLQSTLRQRDEFVGPGQLLDSLRKSLEGMGDEGKKMGQRISTCCNHIHSLKALYQHVADRGELTKETIVNAMTRATYKWLLDSRERRCQLELSYEIRKQGQQDKVKKSKRKHGFHLNKQENKSILKTEELTDLRSRALLISGSDKELPNKAKSVASNMVDFVKVVDIAQNIAQTVTTLRSLGHFSYQKYSKTISCKHLLSDLEIILAGLQSDLEEWKEILKKKRQLYQCLIIIYSDQLSLIDAYLRVLRNVDQSLSPSEDDALAENVNHLLHFLHPGLSREHLVKFLPLLPVNTKCLRNKLEVIGETLDKATANVEAKRKLFPTNNEFTLQANDCTAVVERGHLFIAHLDANSTQTIPVLLSLYFNTVQHFPVPSEVLFCHENTSWEELHLIVQRSARSSSLFCIANVESLQNDFQYKLVDKLSCLVDSADEIHYRLAVICRGGTHHSIIDHFSTFVRQIQGFDDATLKVCLQTSWPDVLMMTSAVPGLGKTEFIRNLAADSHKCIKSVNISGPITREALVDRLKKCSVQSNDMLHIDIAEVSDAGFLDACLFELIVLGCVCSGTNVACLPTATVAIEVANTVRNRLKDSLVVVSSFKREHLKWNNYEDYIVSREIFSPVQIVCRYLQQLDLGRLDLVDVKLVDSKALSDVECRKLLGKHFNANSDTSFAMLEIYLNVFSGQLRQLSNSQFFTVKNLALMLGNTKPIDVRSQLVKALMDVAKEFSLRSVQSCRSVQSSARNAETFDPMLKSLTVAEELVRRVQGMIQWEDSNHLIIAFHGSSSQTVSFLYRDVNLVPQHVVALYRSQTKRELDDFKALSHQALHDILCQIIKASTLSTSHSIASQERYALTPDNLLKMVLILLRIRANVPVVIMGETGCGKTSLIRFLASLCQIKSEHFKHFGLHAGTTEEELCKVVSESSEKCEKIPTKQVWLFLDEINTCNHMGLLTELICHNSCFGKALCRNLVLIAACNPYKLREQHQINTAGLIGKVKDDEYSRLVYRVHPLSETMLDYVWDYGSLDSKDEAKYIREMVSSLFPESCPSWELKECIVNLLVASQDFTRNVDGNGWCVSLRDVNRCRLLMEYFLRMLREKAKFTKKGHDSHDGKDVYVNAIVLAVAHCYVSRFATTQHRQEYWGRCASILLKDANKYDELVKIVRNEQLDLLNRMVIPDGIAKNTALRENVFTILVCILNKIPVFLVGKPGCSKSLSLQLIKSNLRGKDSRDEYFQTLPNLYVVSYQGSESSTSEGIEKVFAKAEKYRKANQEDNVLPVVLLDEVGLAEASKFNPLKVLHGLLEPNTGELPLVAVVGISNWALDAAKMNRAIHISRPDMDEGELYDTGIAISTVKLEEKLFELGSSDSSESTKCVVPEAMLKALAEAYFRYQMKTRQKVKNFHGLRDYYSLIKYVSRHMAEQSIEESDRTEICAKGIRRNFGGLVYELSDIIQHFSAVVQAKDCLNWRVEEIIEDNIKDSNARHLMVITKGDSALGILLSQISVLQRQSVVIIGSKFEEDQTEDYSYRILNRIILCMEAGNILMLKDLDSIYGSLYDMLNQNYTIVGKKKNCRIALGPYSNPMCQVHEDFRCVVLVEEPRVDYSDPPFLNRFEKQVLRFEDLILSDQRQMIGEISEWMQALSTVPGLSFTMERTFMGLNSDTVPSFVYQLCNFNVELLVESGRSVVDECKDVVLWLILPDAMLRASKSTLAKKDCVNMDSFCQKYLRQPVHKGLSHVFSVILEQQHEFETPRTFADMSHGCRLVIYSHSVIHVNLHSILADFEPICVEKLGAFKSEKQLTKQIRKFFESDMKIFILQCRPSEDWQHISLAKFQLEELQYEYCEKSGEKKHICLIFHMERCSDMSGSSSWQFSYLSGWCLLTVDSLENQGNFELPSLLDQTACEMLNTDFQPIKKCILERLLWAFTCTSSSYGERTTEELLEVVRKISSSNRLLECFSTFILAKLKLSEITEEDIDSYSAICKPWLVNVACDMLLLRSATSFVDALKHYLVQFVSVPLAKVVYKLESMSAWHSYFATEEQQTLWETFFHQELIFSIDDIEQVPRLDCFKINHKPLNLRFPFSLHFIHKLCAHADLFLSDLVVLESDADNLTECDGSELKASVYCELFGKYRELFAEDLTLLFEQCDFEQYHSDFISDLCNYLALDHMSNEEDRVDVALWFVGYRSFDHTSKDALTNVTESLLCLWRYEELFRNILRMIAECQHILPTSVKLILEQIGCRMLETQPLDAHYMQDDVMEAADDFSHVQQEPDEFNHALDDSVANEPTRNNSLSHAQKDSDDILLAQSNSVLEELTQDKNASEFTDSQADSGQDKVAQAYSNTSLYEFAQSDWSAINENFAHSSVVDLPDDYEESGVLITQQNIMLHAKYNDIVGSAMTNDKRYLEEQLVCHLCEVLKPSEQVFASCGGIDGWQLRVCSVLSYCGLVSEFPKLPYVLRVCNDLATVLSCSHVANSQIEKILVELVHQCHLSGDHVAVENVSDMFDGVLNVLNQLQATDIAPSWIQHFFTLYIGRCMDTNEVTDIVSHVLNEMTRKTLPEKSLAFCEPVICRIFIQNMEHISEIVDWLQDENRLDYKKFTYFRELDEALKENSHTSNPDFLALCVDVIGQVVMAKSYLFDKDNTLENLTDIESAEDIRLVTFKASVAVLQNQQICCLRLAFASAYAQAFVQQLACILAKDNEQDSFDSHRLLYQHVDAALSGLTLRCLLDVLVKELKSHGRTLTHVAGIWKKAAQQMMSLSVIEWPEYNVELTLSYRIVGLAGGVEVDHELEQGLRNLGSDDEPVKSYISTHLKTPKGVTSLIEAVANVVYLQKASRSLIDSEKEVGEWFSRNISMLDSPLDKLILRLSSKDLFGVDILQLKPESGLVQLQQASFLVHLMSAVIGRKSAAPFDLLFNFMRKPQHQIYKEIGIAASTLNRTSQEAFAKQSRETFITCQCWSRLCISESKYNQCPLCNWKWPQRETVEPIAADEDDINYAKSMQCRRLVAMNILKIVFDASILNGLGLGLLSDAEMLQFYQCTSGTNDQLCKMACDSFQESWNVLLTYLSYSVDELSLVLHRVVDSWDVVGCQFGGVKLGEISSVIHLTGEKLSEMFLGRNSFSDLRSYLSSVCVSNVTAVKSSYEITTNDDPAPEDWYRALFRQTKKRTMKDMLSEYSLSSSRIDHPVIGLFFDTEPALKLVKHLSPILKWVRLCNGLISHRLSREECKTNTISKLIQQSQSDKQSKNFEDCFKCFLESWDELRTQECCSVLNKFDESLSDVLVEGILPQIHRLTAVQLVIIDGTHALLYRILRVLADIQNTFLDHLLEIACGKGCPAIGFLRKVGQAGGAAASVRCVLLQNVKIDQIIEFNLPQLMEELSMFAQNNLEYGYGKCISYDFVKIEMELSNQLALGKVHMVLDGSFPFASYANEMFVTCSTVLREFAVQVPQKQIGTAIKNSIDSRRKENAEYVLQMMRQTEILLCIAKRTGGSGTQTLVNFVQQWLVNLPGGFATELFPSGAEPLRLCHVVDLYELLEDMHADVVMDTIPDCFRATLSDQVRSDIKQFLEKNLVKADSLRTALRRFVMRHVVNMSVKQTNPDEPLVTWLKDPALWPDGVNDQGNLTSAASSSSQLKVLKDEFPQLLILKYVYHAVKYVEELIETQRRGKFIPTAKLPNTPAVAAVKQAPRGARQVKTLRMGRT